jgi:hypothetical protein
MAFSFASARPVRRIALCLLLAGAVHGQALSQAPWRPVERPSPERRTRAAYLYRFAAFVEWPATAFARPDSPLLIGIAGDDVLAALVEQSVAGRSVRGHPLAVLRFDPGAASDADMRGLHILYATGPDAAPMLAQARGRPVLTVCDMPAEPAAAGAACVVEFVQVGEHLRFHVAREEAAAARLRISARLLAVAP